MPGHNRYISRMNTIDEPNPIIDIENFSEDSIEFVEQIRILKKKKFSFKDRPYLKPLYRDDAKHIRIRKGRQTEISEFLINKIFELAYKFPGSVHLYMSDRSSHTSIFSNLRVLEWTIKASQVIMKRIATVKGHTATKLSFMNGSVCFFFSGWSNFDEALSIPADFVYIDERQKQNGENIAKVKEALAHSTLPGMGRMFEVGTGPLEGDEWDVAYQATNQLKWIKDTWIPQNPGAKIHGYWIPQTIVPWITEEDIADKKAEYTPADFSMEVMGEPHKAAAKPITHQMMRMLHDPTMSFMLPDEIDLKLGPLFFGLDHGGGETAFTVPAIWQLVDDTIPHKPKFELRYIEKIIETDEEKQLIAVRKVIDEYNPVFGVQDAGGAPYQIKKIKSEYDKVKTCHYLPPWIDPPVNYEKLYPLNQVQVNRTWAIDNIIRMVTEQRLLIPYDEDVEKDVDFITDHFVAIEAITSKSAQGENKIYIHGKLHPDDGLHSTLYMWLAYLIWKRKHAHKGAFAVGKMGR